MTDEHLRATISLRGVLFSPHGDVLVVRRSSDGGWELPGGRLEAREDAPDGVRREFEEETGLDVRVVRPVHAASWRNDADSGRFAVYYRCEVADEADVDSDLDADTDVDREAAADPVSLSREHTQHAWLSPAAAADRLSEVQERAVSIATEGHQRE